MSKGRQLYVICPRIDEPDPEKETALNMKSAVAEAKRLKKEVFKDCEIGVLHSKMTKQKKEEVMAEFSEGKIDILVATSVIEVGVNVPNATIIMIEGAERFGLAQLHQLRGRVGRGGEQSYCILMIGKEGLTEENMARIRVMEETNDGFKIAEEDLKLRGPGEFFGTKQSGLPELKMAHILFDRELMKKAREAAFDLVKKDPHLRGAENVSVKRKFMKEYYDKLGLGEVG